MKLASDIFSVRCLLVFLVKTLRESLGIIFLYTNSIAYGEN